MGQLKNVKIVESGWTSPPQVALYLRGWRSVILSATTLKINRQMTVMHRILWEETRPKLSPRTQRPSQQRLQRLIWLTGRLNLTQRGPLLNQLHRLPQLLLDWGPHAVPRSYLLCLIGWRRARPVLKMRC